MTSRLFLRGSQAVYANLRLSLTKIYGSDAARSWGASAVLGVTPMSNWRGFPHSRNNQDSGAD
ncbi:MAG: hypothetical protein F6J98_49095 [Moorea sp. SIO4G2]|nr:hypothetical protein [Moorena sp. SIO4G2]